MYHKSAVPWDFFSGIHDLVSRLKLADFVQCQLWKENLLQVNIEPQMVELVETLNDTLDQQLSQPDVPINFVAWQFMSKYVELTMLKCVPQDIWYYQLIYCILALYRRVFHVLNEEDPLAQQKEEFFFAEWLSSLPLPEDFHNELLYHMDKPPPHRIFQGKSWEGKNALRGVECWISHQNQYVYTTVREKFLDEKVLQEELVTWYPSHSFAQNKIELLLEMKKARFKGNIYLFFANVLLTNYLFDVFI
jgi:hypothetical protein